MAVFTETSGVAESVYGKAQAPIRLFIESKNNELGKKSSLPKIFKMDKSTHFGEMRTGMTAMTGFRPVGENAAAPEDTMSEGYSSILKNITWKDEFAISREMVEDSLLIDFNKRPLAFVEGYHRAREQLGANLLGGAIKNADLTTDAGKKITINSIDFSTLSADGKNLFAKAHPSKAATSVTQCNSFTDAFSYDALCAMECEMQNFRGDNNDILGVVPDTIVIPNIGSLKKKVFAAIGADKDPETANNGFNFQFGRWTVVIWPFLNQYITAGTEPWILLSSTYNNSYDGLVFQDRTDLDVRSYINDSTDANIWHGFSRFTAGFHDWRAVCCGGVAAGKGNTLITTSTSTDTGGGGSGSET